MVSLGHIAEREGRRRRAISGGRVVSDEMRCIQCGICSFSCPMGIDIRRYSWYGEPVTDSRCIACGECVGRCPRGAISLEPCDGMG